MKYEFCTYFDKNYTVKGLTLYNSLLEHCEDFRLWILCMDDEVYGFLKKANLKKIELIRLKDFEDEELLRAKKTRSFGEYCWTCSPSLPLYIFKQNPKIKTLTYLDADLFFYSSPKPIYNETGEKSIMIIPHRVPQDKKELEKVNGIYNVGMLIFKNNQDSKECLEWWRERCNEWCYMTPEDGKLGDQKYLDEFPKKFKNVYVLKHEGANVAPWNTKNHKITKKNSIIKSNNNDLIFYHFSSFKIYPESLILPSIPWSHEYSERSINYKLLYKPYIKETYNSIKKIHKLDKSYPDGTTKRPKIKQQMKENVLPIIKSYIKNIWK